MSKMSALVVSSLGFEQLRLSLAKGILETTRGHLGIEGPSQTVSLDRIHPLLMQQLRVDGILQFGFETSTCSKKMVWICILSGFDF